VNIHHGLVNSVFTISGSHVILYERPRVLVLLLLAWSLTPRVAHFSICSRGEKVSSFLFLLFTLLEVSKRC